jgi:hypothetical protein
MTRHVPFRNIRSEVSVVVHILEGGRPKRKYCQGINDRIWEMLEMCWDEDPNKRPPMKDVFDFFRSEMLHRDLVG